MWRNKRNVNDMKSENGRHVSDVSMQFFFRVMNSCWFLLLLYCNFTHLDHHIRTIAGILQQIDYRNLLLSNFGIHFTLFFHSSRFKIHISNTQSVKKNVGNAASLTQGVYSNKMLSETEFCWMKRRGFVATFRVLKKSMNI